MMSSSRLKAPSAARVPAHSAGAFGAKMPPVVRRSAPFDPEGVVRFLRRAYPTATGPNVEAATGIAAKTVGNWLIGRATPSAAHMGLLIDRFGPAILSAAYPGTERWLGGQVRRERIENAMAELEAALS